MGKRVGMEVSIAAAEAVKQANVDVISAYPITPQTHIVEHLSELVANGELDAEFFLCGIRALGIECLRGERGNRGEVLHLYQLPGVGPDE